MMKLTADRTDAMVREIPFTADGEIRVILSAGELRLVATDEPTVRIRSRDDRPVDDVVRISRSDDGLDIRANDEPSLQIGPLRIGADPSDGPEPPLRIGPLVIGGRGSAELEIHAPRSSRLVVRTASADVTAEGFTGDSRWASASGDLRLRLDGGALRFETMSGDVTVDAAHPLRVDARSVSGEIRLRAPGFAELHAGTTSGDLTVDGVLEAGPHLIETISGDTRVITPSGVRIEPTTVTGDVDVKGADRIDEGGRVVRVGDGGATVRWRSMSGDLTIVADQAPARPPAPVPPAPRAAPEPPAAPGAPEDPEPVVVAEAQAAPNLVRPAPIGADAEGRADPSPAPASAARADLSEAIEQRAAARRSRTERREAARLEVLHAVERGELSIDEAAVRLAALDDVMLSGGGAV
jgi:hypothetical protein